jgi:histidinol-phosphate aminotransferase
VNAADALTAVPVSAPGRAALRGIAVYDADAVDGPIDLSDNTNAWGIPPAAINAIADSNDGRLARYPGTYSARLRQAIADYIGVDAEEVVTGCGSGELIDCAFRALCEPGQRVAYMDPTFVMTRVFAATNSLVPTPVALRADGEPDVEGLISTAPALIYLCSPNNPTGVAIRPQTIDSVTTRFRGPVVLDEAYGEFATTTYAAAAPARPGLLVLRTMSKAWGLAGLRIGYALGERGLVRELARVRGPFKVSAVAEQAAEAALRTDEAWVRDVVAMTKEIRERFLAALHIQGLAPLPSDANFVLIPLPDAASARRALLAKNISVRAFTALPGIGDAIRVTIAPWPVMEQVLATLAEPVT